MTSNATRVLDYWGLDYEKAGAVENRQVSYDSLRESYGSEDGHGKFRPPIIIAQRANA